MRYNATYMKLSEALSRGAALSPYDLSHQGILFWIEI